jgi:hypothetical protein
MRYWRLFSGCNVEDFVELPYYLQLANLVLPEWNGACTCPDGHVYNVCAHHIRNTTNCESLACYGGVSKGCSNTLFSTAVNPGVGLENKNAVLCGVRTRGLGEWHGDMWIPPMPDRQLLSSEEARRLVFKFGKSIAFFGNHE